MVYRNIDKLIEKQIYIYILYIRVQIVSDRKKDRQNRIMENQIDLDRQIDRQIDYQIARKTNIQIDKQIVRQINIYIYIYFRVDSKTNCLDSIV